MVTYKILHLETKSIFQAKSLEKFAEEHGLTRRLLARTLTGERNHHKGYRILERMYSKEKANPIKTAIVVSDIHFCYQDDAALDILYRVAKDLKSDVSEFIDLGDGINNNALSKFSDVEKKKYSLYQEVTAYSRHMEKIRSILGKDVKYTICQDNHYHLRKKRFLAENPAFEGLLPDIGELFDEEIPHAKLYFPFKQRRFGFIHGVAHNDMFTKAHLMKYGKYDCLSGHTHTVQTYVMSSGNSEDEARRSYGIPSMCKRMEYTDGVPTRQVTGFTVVTFDEQTENYNVEYVIIEKGQAIFRGKKY